ncbi:hypothetical protein KC19_4G203700 [Ceratodon purpureus]|uniref:Uncharacterized protein n=1 Tax=Ceratodon purpureus TaxID=3225 RepID=A0A8T0ID46_CERPU|nr:hypothetical protein KC19_4G203700 [Ceratodon purpureus]
MAPLALPRPCLRHRHSRGRTDAIRRHRLPRSCQSASELACYRTHRSSNCFRGDSTGSPSRLNIPTSCYDSLRVPIVGRGHDENNVRDLCPTVARPGSGGSPFDGYMVNTLVIVV